MELPLVVEGDIYASSKYYLAPLTILFGLQVVRVCVVCLLEQMQMHFPLSNDLAVTKESRQERDVDNMSSA
jgi:hypothetical protein